MSEQKNRELLEALFNDGELKLLPEEEYDARAEDYVMEMPQSSERIVGRARMKAFQEAYPNPPSAKLRRIVGSGDLFIVEARSDYGNEVAFVTDIVEFDGDGKIARETRYYASPFEPPAWRAEWVELMS